MARTINESITALENARNDIVDALNSKIEGGGIEKTIKISEVADKINSIEVGGGGGLNWLENVTKNGQPVNGSLYSFDIELDDPISISGTLKFTPKENVNIYSIHTQPYNGAEITPKVDLSESGSELTKGTEYTITYQNVSRLAFVFKKGYTSNFEDPADIFMFEVF